jgi:hypothetical protein
MIKAPVCSLTVLAVLLAAGLPAKCAGLSPSRNVYFDPSAIGASPEAFNPAIAIPDYTPSRPWGFDAAKPAEPKLGPWRPAPIGTNNETKEDDSAGRIPLNGGSFGIETERKFNADKSIPTSQYFEGAIDRYSKKPFVGLSIEAPFNSEDR